MNSADAWPDLPLQAWMDTYATLHLWTQIVGKLRLAGTPWINHSWHVTLYLTARGLTTSLIPCRTRGFSIDFDFISHRLIIRTVDGIERLLPLRAQSVSQFYAEVLGELEALGIALSFSAVPNEIEHPLRFADDHQHASYDPHHAHCFWRILVQVHRVFQIFRSRFIGKCSPVHFFWGSFDLAVTRFSGRPAPLHPGGVPHLPDWVVREAYSHEVSSCGFWPGGGPHPYPLFYSYAYPEPEGFRSADAGSQAFYSSALREFILPYEAVRIASDPDATLLAFCESTYVAAADLGKWDRPSLERPVPSGLNPRHGYRR